MIKLEVFLLLLYASTSIGSGIEYTIESYPNPKLDYISCKREKPSLLCDPQQLISKSSADYIDTLLEEIRTETDSECTKGGEVALLLMNKFYTPPNTEQSEQAQTMSRGIHDLWGVGSATCNNGVVFLLSKEDRQLFISTGKGVMNTLTDSIILRIIEKMKPGLRNGDYDSAIIAAVEDIKNVLLLKPLPPEETDYMLIFWGIAFLGICLVCMCGSNTNSEYTVVKKKLDKIQRQAKAKKFDNKTCPICLEDFKDQTSVSILDCGHSFCKTCIREWKKKNQTCPTCRYKIKEISREKDSTDQSQYNHELGFYLHSLHLQHPSYVTPTMVRTWSNYNYNSDFSSDPLFVSLAPIVSSSRSGGSSSSGWGGGSSSGGGGAGGSW